MKEDLSIKSSHLLPHVLPQPFTCVLSLQPMQFLLPITRYTSTNNESHANVSALPLQEKRMGNNETTRSVETSLMHTKPMPSPRALPEPDVEWLEQSLHQAMTYMHLILLSLQTSLERAPVPEPNNTHMHLTPVLAENALPGKAISWDIRALQRIRRIQPRITQTKIRKRRPTTVVKARKKNMRTRSFVSLNRMSFTYQCTYFFGYVRYRTLN